MATIMQGSVVNQRALHFGLLLAQALLACIVAAMASLKLVLSYDRVVEIMAWAASLPPTLVRAIGAAELLCAVAVAVPAVTRVPQRIVGWVAAAVVAGMTVLAIANVVRGDLRLVPINLAIGALALFVAWGRLTHEPLEESGPVHH
jgi:putative oxidoreductase